MKLKHGKIYKTSEGKTYGRQFPDDKAAKRFNETELAFVQIKLHKALKVPGRVHDSVEPSAPGNFDAADEHRLHNELAENREIGHRCPSKTFKPGLTFVFVEQYDNYHKVLVKDELLYVHFQGKTLLEELL